MTSNANTFCSLLYFTTYFLSSGKKIEVDA